MIARGIIVAGCIYALATAAVPGLILFLAVTGAAFTVAKTADRSRGR